MPTQADELLYKNAVEWIKNNPQDGSIPDEIKKAFLKFNTLEPKEKGQLLIKLKEIVEPKGVPKEIKQ